MIPSEQFLSTVFETSFPDVQPYLHRVSFLHYSYSFAITYILFTLSSCLNRLTIKCKHLMIPDRIL
jgi:hypothetical protein